MVCVMSIIDSRGTMYSRSGTGSLLRSHGVTRWIFFQWTASMSTIRSRMIGMLPIGSTVITVGLSGSWPRSAASSRWVLHASPGLPFIRTPHEPQIACWHEQRIPIDPSLSSRIWRIASSTDWWPLRSTVCSSQWGASPAWGSYRRILSVYSGISTSFPRAPSGSAPFADTSMCLSH